MDGYNDLYGGDQYKVSPVKPYPEMNDVYSSGASQGYYEDNLRMSQQGISAHARPQNANPYIQDDIRDSQRHNPVRIGSVGDRAAAIAHARPELGHANMFGGRACGYADGQRIVYVGANEQCPQNLHVKCDDHKSSKSKSKSKSKSSRTIELDQSNIMFMFLLVVLVFVCVQFMQTGKSVKEAVSGGFKTLANIIDDGGDN